MNRKVILLALIMFALTASLMCAKIYYGGHTLKTSVAHELWRVTTIFDINGRTVKNLIHQNMQPGTHKAIWNAHNEPSGTYLIYFSANDFQQTGKCLLLK